MGKRDTYIVRERRGIKINKERKIIDKKIDDRKTYI
jgi:hypothetical protein